MEVEITFKNGEKSDFDREKLAKFSGYFKSLFGAKMADSEQDP